MPILVDGNNLMHRLPRGSRSRMEVRRLILDAVRHERMAVVVVFDGPPPAGAPPEESLGSATIIYSGAAVADDVIVGRLPDGAAARQWVVVTDDRALKHRVRQHGAEVRSLAEWQRKRATKSKRVARESKLSSHEVQEWEQFFASGGPEDE